MVRYYKLDEEGNRIEFPGYIETDHGTVYPRPTRSLILAYGWIEEILPDPEPEVTPQGEPDFEEKMKGLMADVFPQSRLDGMTDAEALDNAVFFPTWESLLWKEVKAGERIWDDGKLWRVVQTHTEQDDWRPAVTPALFTEVSLDEWPEWKQPTGAQDAYNKGDKVTFNGKHYVSLIDGNTWSPADYPAGWEERP